MKIRIRDKNSKTNPIKMLRKKREIFKWKILFYLSTFVNIILACFLYF